MAITVTASDIAELTGVTPTIAQRLLSVASQLVRDYVDEGDVPDPLLNEAVIRACVWLRSSQAGSILSESAGPLRVRYDLKDMNCLSASGAASLLNTYKAERMAL